MNSTRLSLAFVLACLLALSLISSWSLRVVNGHQVQKFKTIQELFAPYSDADSDLWMNHEFAMEMSSHPAFDEHLDSVLADLHDLDFDIESDEVLMEYMSTLSDTDAKFFRRAFRRIGRAFRGIGRVVRGAGRVFRAVGKGLGKIGKGVGKFVKKYGKILIPVALTLATGGIGGFSLAGTLGGTLAKGAALLAKGSAILGKGQAILGGLNLVTGGKSKFLNKALNFTNKVSGILGKGSMFLGAGNSIVSGLSNFSVKNLVSQLKPSELFKGKNLFEKGSTFFNKASGLIKKGQEFTSNLNNLTGGKVKFINKLSGALDKAQTITGIGGDALNGLNGGLNSLKNLKNLKNVDLKKLLTAENFKNGLSKLDATIAKTQDIVSRVNDVTGGKNKSIGKILEALNKGKMVVGVGSTAVDRYNDVKGAIADLKNLKNVDLKKLLTTANIQKGLTNLDGTLGKGKDLLSQINAITGGKSKALNNLIAKIEKGQQAVGIGSTVVDQYSGIKSSIEQLSKLKSKDLKKLLTFDNIQTGLTKVNGALASGEKLATQLNEFTNGKSKTLVELISKLQKGQKVTAVTSSILDGAKGAKESIEKLKNLKKEDLEKLLTAEGFQSALNNVAQAFSKGENIASQLNELTNGRNKDLVRLVTALRNGQKIATTGSNVVDKVKAIKSSVESLKELNGKDLLNEENLKKALEGIGAAFENGKEIFNEVKTLRNDLKNSGNTETPAAEPDVAAEPSVEGQSTETPQPIEMPVENLDPATAAG